jgi:hypothetical protein
LKETNTVFGNSKRGGESGPLKIRDSHDRKREELLKATNSTGNLGSGFEANPGPGSY